MANAEMQLVSRIVRTGDLAPVIDWGISEFDFRTTEGRSLFQYIAGYYSAAETRGSVIGTNLFASMFAQFTPCDDPSVTTDALCFQVRQSRIVAEAKEAGLQLIENIEVDPAGAISILHSHMQNLLALGTTKNVDMTLRDAMMQLKARYELLKVNQFAFAKMLWPWELMNEVTGGITEEDYICFYGRPKSMKTWVLTYLLSSCFQQGKKALVYTKEMTQLNIFQRIAACIMRVPYQELRTGGLSFEDERLLNSLVEEVQSIYNPSNIICLSGKDVQAGGDTVPWIMAKAEKYKPDVIFIDGMYLLSDARSKKNTQDWQRVMNISRDIRQMVLATRTPVVCTMQANRGAAKHSDANLDEIAFSDALSQDVTAAIRVMNEKATPTIALALAGSREFKLHGVRINGLPAVNFDFHSIMTEREIFKAKEGDVEDDVEGSTKHATKRKPRGTNGVANGVAVPDTAALVQEHLRVVG